LAILLSHPFNYVYFALSAKKKRDCPYFL